MRLASSESAGKIPELQGLRGLAIAMVMLFHFTVRWDSSHVERSLYPYGDAFSSMSWLLGKGAWGVELFFVISGYVILLTLSRSRSLGAFWINRFSRLWPPLIPALVTVFLVLKVSPPLPGASTSVPDLVSSFTLIDPVLLSEVAFHLHEFRQVTGVLWTLWVELLFYVLASLIYFRSTRFLRGIAFAAVLLTAVRFLPHFFPNALPIWAERVSVLGLYIWWFVAGAAVYSIRSRQSPCLSWCVFLTSFAVSLAGAFTGGFSLDALGHALLIIAVYSGFACFALGRRLAVVTARPLVFLGSISYELYLIHEAVGVSLLQSLTRPGGIESPALVLLPIVATIAVSAAIYFGWSKTVCAAVRGWLVRQVEVSR